MKFTPNASYVYADDYVGGSALINLEPKKELVDATSILDLSYDNIKAVDETTYNCFGNAIGKQIKADPTGYVEGESTERTFLRVQNDLGWKNVRRLNSIDDPIGDDEYRVAMRCGPHDYHFIRQLDDGTWYNKSGTNKGGWVTKSYVQYGSEEGNWYAYNPYALPDEMYKKDDEFTYSYQIIFFAVKKGWDTK